MGFLFGRFCSFILFSNLSHHHHLPWLIEVEEGTFCYITNSDWANAGQLLRTSTTKWHDMLRTKPGLLFLDEKILLYIEEQWQRGRLWEINSSPLILNGIKSSWWVSLYQVRLMQSGRRQTLMCVGGLITETIWSNVKKSNKVNVMWRSVCSASGGWQIWRNDINTKHCNIIKTLCSSAGAW